MSIDFQAIPSTPEVKQPPVAPSPSGQAPPVTSPAPASQADVGAAFQVAVSDGLSQRTPFAPAAPIWNRPATAPECAANLQTLLGQVAELRQEGEIPSQSMLQALNDRLGELDRSGKLQAKDANGTTLAQHLSTIMATPPAAGLQTGLGPALRGHVARAILDNIAEPHLINQRGSTCAAKAFEYMKASQDPAGYAAMVGKLAAGHDAPALAGLTVTLDQTALAAEKTDNSRNLASRLFQSSVNHTFATNFFGRQTYANADADMVNGRGLENDEAGKAAQALLGGHWTEQEGAPDLTTLRLPIMAGVGWHMSAEEITDDDPSNGHAIVITKVANGRAYFVDAGERGSKGQHIQANGRDYGPPRDGEGDSVYSMPVHDLQKLVNYYVAPKAP
jgi:hypothetical protein